MGGPTTCHKAEEIDIGDRVIADEGKEKGEVGGISMSEDGDGLYDRVLIGWSYLHEGPNLQTPCWAKKTQY